MKRSLSNVLEMSPFGVHAELTSYLPMCRSNVSTEDLEKMFVKKTKRT
jgi:hypothetical protein